MLSTTEAQEQICLFQWAQYHEQKFKDLCLLHHVPNGGKRDAKTAASLKRQGVKAGVPDLVLPSPHGGYCGLYIELKVGNNKPTGKQIEWMELLKDQGYFVTVCYGWRDAADTIENYLMQPKDNIKKDITVKYNIGSKPHEEIFKSSALFGQWYIHNYRNVKIMNIDEGEY